VRGTPADASTLNYLRDTIGLITFFVDNGGCAIYDPLMFRWWQPSKWRDQIFNPAAAVPRRHAVILFSEEDNSSSKWFHTRGMRKFGRPDVSVHNVPPELEGAVIDLCERLIEHQAFGLVVPDGQEIRMASLPPGAIMRHRGDLDDPDFNNVHLDVVWPNWHKHGVHDMSHLPDSAVAEADLLLCGYEVGYFDKSDIAQWADRQIAAIANPSAELLDLSMIRHTYPIDVMNLLRSLGSPDLNVRIQNQIGFIGLLYGEKKLTLQRAIGGLLSLVHQPGLTQEQRSQIYYLDDGYDLAVAGAYGTLAQIERDFSNFVSPYTQRLGEYVATLVPK
jgi:hypothetical protein